MRGTFGVGLSLFGLVAFACDGQTSAGDGMGGSGDDEPGGTANVIGGSASAHGGVGSGGSARGGSAGGGVGGAPPAGGAAAGGAPQAGGALQAGGARSGGEGGDNDRGGGTAPVMNGGSAGAVFGEGNGGAGGEAVVVAEPLQWPTTTRPTWDGTMSADGVESVHGVRANFLEWTNNDLYSVWRKSDGRLWIAGAGGTLARMDSSNGEWSGVTGVGAELGSDFAFHMIRGHYYGDIVWALGWADSSGTQALYRFYDGKWAAMPRPAHRVRAIGPSGNAELWTTDDDHFVSHWDGSQWTDIDVGKEVSGIFAFSSSDVWVSGETVLHFDGSVWTDEGGGGPTIWGPSSGDMWTGNGAHLESGVWVQYAGEGTGFDLVIGSSATSVFFRGAGANPRNYFFDGETFSPARGMSHSLDIWPAEQSYWFVGKRDPDLGQGNLAVGWPLDTAVQPSQGHLEWGPEADPIYKSSGATLLQKVGNAYLPIKTFDSSFTGNKPVAYTGADIWVCVGGKVQHNDGEDWSDWGVDCDALQVDGNGRLWVLASGTGTDRIRVHDGRAWQTLPTPAGFVARDLAARFDEAWVLGTTTALRRSGDHWDEYRLGVDAKRAPKTMNISQDGVLFFDYPNLYLATTFAH